MGYESKGEAVVRTLVLPPTNDAWVQIRAVIIGLSLLLVLSFGLRGFSLGTPVFLSS